jgi:hypothetical protein
VKIIHLKASVASLAGVLACLALLGIIGPASPMGPRFRNLREAAAWATGHGLFCQADRADGQVCAGLALAGRPLDWQVVNRLRKSPGPQWQGVVWVTPLGPNLANMPSPPWDGECRVWGRVLATGDPALLDWIERGGQSD